VQLSTGRKIYRKFEFGLEKLTKLPNLMVRKANVGAYFGVAFLQRPRGRERVGPRHPPGGLGPVRPLPLLRGRHVRPRRPAPRPRQPGGPRLPQQGRVSNKKPTQKTHLKNPLKCFFLVFF
jgi:hypothetical protein